MFYLFGIDKHFSDFCNFLPKIIITFSEGIYPLPNTIISQCRVSIPKAIKIKASA